MTLTAVKELIEMIYPSHAIDIHKLKTFHELRTFVWDRQHPPAPKKLYRLLLTSVEDVEDKESMIEGIWALGVAKTYAQAEEMFAEVKAGKEPIVIAIDLTHERAKVLREFRGEGASVEIQEQA